MGASKPRSNLKRPVGLGTTLVSSAGEVVMSCDINTSSGARLRNDHLDLPVNAALAIEGSQAVVVVNGEVVAEFTDLALAQRLAICLNRGHSYSVRLRFDGQGAVVDVAASR